MKEALQFFEEVTQGMSAGEMLRNLRPLPVSAAASAAALAGVPRESVLQPDASERTKLAALEAVLTYHERQHVFAIELIDVPVAAINLYDRAVVLISRPALRLLSSSELQAAVAHEIGHEYFWSDYARLRAREDTLRLQTLELKCDGIAVLTLLALGIDPTHMYRAAAKIGQFNEVATARWGTDGYPHPRDRQRFVDALVRIVVVKAEPHDWAAPGELMKTGRRAFEEWLDTARPKPLSMEDRTRVLGALPSYGEIKRLNRRGQRKLAAIRALLQAMGRTPAYEIKVVDVPILRVGVYARTVILISAPALSILRSEELQALAAHEIGHEYFTTEYERASGLDNTGRLKQLELMCDAIALVTLERLRINPSRLMSALVKSTSYNRLHFGDDSMDESAYPALSERRVFAGEVIAWILSGR